MGPRVRGISIAEILLYNDLDESTLFDDDLTSKPNKSELVKELEGKLQSSDYDFNKQ